MLQEVYGKRLGSVWKVWEVNWKDEKCMRSMVSVWEAYGKCVGGIGSIWVVYGKHGKCKGIVREVYQKYWKGIGRMEKCMKSIGSVWEG